MIFVYLFIWVAIATAADYFFKFAPAIKSSEFLYGTMLYAICGYFAFTTFHDKSWSWVILMWNTVSLILSLILSVIVFHEPFTVRKLIAATALLIAVFMVE